MALTRTEPNTASAGPEIRPAGDLLDSPAPDDDRMPRKLRRIKGSTWKYVFKRALSKFSSDGGTDTAAGLTYYAIFSLFPAILALVSVLGLIGKAEETTSAILSYVGQLTDPQMVETLRAPVEQLTSSRASGWTFGIGLATALWSASGYVGAFSRAMNKIYGIAEGRPTWKLRPTLLLVTLGAVVIVAIMGLMLVISGPIARSLGDLLGLGETAVTVWNIAKWPVLGLLAILLIAGLYYFTPNVRQPKFRWISPGATIAFVAMVLASAGFGFYVANFGKYEKTYGTIAGLIVLLLWIWIINLTLLLGAEVDTEVERARELQAGFKAEEQLLVPPRQITASLKQQGKQQALIAEGKRIRQEHTADSPASGAKAQAEAKAFYALAAAGIVAVTLGGIFRRKSTSKKSSPKK